MNPQAILSTLTSGQWNLAALNGTDISKLAGQFTGDRLPSLSIKPDGSLGGFAGVNRWGSKLQDLTKLASGDFSMGPAIATKMAGPPEAMKLENDFLGALNNVKKLDTQALSKGSLRLLGQDGGELLRFVQAGR